MWVFEMTVKELAMVVQDATRICVIRPDGTSAERVNGTWYGDMRKDTPRKQVKSCAVETGFAPDTVLVYID